MCSKISGLKDEEHALKLGIVGAKLFAKLCLKDGKQEELIRSYLLKFGLAVELKDGKLFIPSIVSEDTVSIIVLNSNHFIYLAGHEIQGLQKLT